MTAKYKRPKDIAKLHDEEILDLRLCDLSVSLDRTAVSRLVSRLYRELVGKGLSFKPHVWLSEEWFCPDGVAGFAIPFYLAHARLVKLERKHMLEVEGEGERECMRILRHEAGHAIDNAFRLHFRRDWQRTFGSFAKRYPEHYRPRPNSRRFVHHLNAWYAQAHPAEDFAETFAVWLNPRSNWRTRYEGWPALEKLEYVDALMQEIAGTRPKRPNRRKVDTLSSLKRTLREHYRKKKLKYGVTAKRFYDRDLQRIFSGDSRYRTKETAASFMRGLRKQVVEVIARGTGSHQYTIDQVLRQMIDRSKELKLRLASPKRRARQDLIIILTVATMNLILGGKNRVAL